jgi:predicted nucleic-acid-binding Zn-ribbon protein
MPLPDGTLTDEEFRLVVQKLLNFWEKGGHGREKPKCPSCGERDFFIHPALFGNRSDTLSPIERHTRLPTVAVYCKECGHLTEYVARVLGIEVLGSGGG